MNAWNSEEDSSGEYASGVSSPTTSELIGLPDVLSVLGYQTNRRILCHLPEQDEELSVEQHTTRIADGRTRPATDGVVSVAERNGEDAQS